MKFTRAPPHNYLLVFLLYPFFQLNNAIPTVCFWSLFGKFYISKRITVCSVRHFSSLLTYITSSHIYEKYSSFISSQKKKLFFAAILFDFVAFCDMPMFSTVCLHKIYLVWSDELIACIPKIFVEIQLYNLHFTLPDLMWLFYATARIHYILYTYEHVKWKCSRKNHV